jgi:hypothetical protein
MVVVVIIIVIIIKIIDLKKFEARIYGTPFLVWMA